MGNKIIVKVIVLKMFVFFTYLQVAEIGCHVGMQLCDPLLQNKEKACKGIKLLIL